MVNKTERKLLLLNASAGMEISLFLPVLAFMLMQFVGASVLLFVLLYIASLAVAMGQAVWVVLSEILSTKTRGRAMFVVTVCLWIAS
ncbi:MAG: sugar porter family MFS transporter [Phycisphaerales bacterium]|nr:sugar porter family MFS transporter [Phycisphaerales bacterium]